MNKNKVLESAIEVRNDLGILLIRLEDGMLLDGERAVLENAYGILRELTLELSSIKR